MTTGYSGTPLVRKLGIKAGHRVLLDGVPGGFELEGLPDGVVVEHRAGGGPYDVVVAFTRDRAALERELPAHEARIERDGAVWVAWPKRASKVPTDLTEDVVREVALPRGLVDVKVCAIDEVWSGLKLVIRRENR
ncbi:DUF3052 family protein [Jiangella rhizosphaerae]|uniref:DUF3052 family protein n=1 Tax=Jiangella rhizosphaerae TaxID=2293569 RepID=A0A418KR74_9ACTN|nr:DUF3052 family protein [Jiangella rhizosphaerae]RIQ24284.1 DUF3052 family protein [Jiangella rhizosphaerae]